jgi:tRNA1Val (adenine37-N6)-methyltransferase
VDGIEPTRDTLFGGRVVLYQPRRGTGYRTNVDALILADFATASRRADVAFDLGAGVGAVGLCLLWLDAAKRVIFVEIDGVAAGLLARNLDANGWTDRASVICADVVDVAETQRGLGNLVVCNPPYVSPGRGRVAPSEALARSGELTTFVRAARQVAGKHARCSFVYPAPDLGHLLASLTAEGLHAKRLRFVHASRDAPARVALVEAVAGRPGGLAVLPALLERHADGYSDEMTAIFQRAPRSRSSAMAHAARTLK